jgi:Protein of unknown function (DUF664)
MPLSPGEPRSDTANAAELTADYLDYYRSAVERKIRGLTGVGLRTSRLPSAWAPLELVRHLVYMERRWFVWGFLAEQVPDPWGDHAGGDPHGRWWVPDGVTLDDLLADLHAGGVRTREILASSPIDARAAVGGRFAAEAGREPPTLGWICFHVLQEYARHAGHLDIARELVDGVTGE